jgi:hypothetical protein
LPIERSVTLVVLAISVLSGGWVWYDASGRDWSRSRFASSAWQWAIGVLLLWLIVLPIYLVKRRHAPVLR